MARRGRGTGGPVGGWPEGDKTSDLSFNDEAAAPTVTPPRGRAADILSRCCGDGDGPHVRGCWVVDLVLGKE